jgi:hypothetical protein
MKFDPKKVDLIETKILNEDYDIKGIWIFKIKDNKLI